MHAEELAAAEIIDQIKDYIVNRILIGVSPGVIHPGDSFLEKGILNSTGVLELVTFVEEKFGITFLDTEIIPENLDSLNAIAAFVNRKLFPNKRLS